MIYRFFSNKSSTVVKNLSKCSEFNYNNIAHLITQSHKITNNQQKKILLNQKILLSIHISTGCLTGLFYMYNYKKK